MKAPTITTKMMLPMIEANTEQSKKNCEVFKKVFETQPSKLVESLLAVANKLP
jgi:hypothetical protein